MRRWKDCNQAGSSSDVASSPLTLFFESIKSGQVQGVWQALREDRQGNLSIAIRHGTLDPKSGQTALHLASEIQNTAMIQFLLGRGANPNHLNKDGKAVLHHLARSNVKIKGEVICWLARHGHADFNQQCGSADTCSATPLSEAIDNFRYPQLAKILLIYGADPTARDSEGRTPLHKLVNSCCVQPKNNTIHGNLAVDHDYNEASPRHQWVNKILPLLMEGEESDHRDARDVMGCTALHTAVYKGDVRLVQALLEHGADPNVTSTTGYTESSPLWTSIQQGQIHCTQWLLDYGAELQDCDGVSNDYSHKKKLPVMVDSAEVVIQTLVNSQAYADTEIEREGDDNSEEAMEIDDDNETRRIIKLTLPRFGRDTVYIPEIFELTKLRELSILMVSVKLPQNIGNLSNLVYLQLGGYDHPSHPGSIEEYVEDSPRALPAGIGLLSNLQTLKLINLPSLEALPVELSNLPKLETLVAENCGIRKFPSAELPQSLIELDLSRCHDLEEMPNNGHVVLPPRLEILCLDKTPLLREGYESDSETMTPNEAVPLDESLLYSMLERHEILGLRWETIPPKKLLFSSRCLYLSTLNQSRGRLLLRPGCNIPLSIWPLILQQVRDRFPVSAVLQTSHQEADFDASEQVTCFDVMETEASVIYDLLHAPALFEHLISLSSRKV